MNRRTVFFVSDQTGVTAETMGHSLLTQFEGQEFRQVTLPFIASVDKAEEAVRKINATGHEDGWRPIVFSTLVKEDLHKIEVWTGRHGIAIAEWPDRPVDPFFNVNTPEDRDRAAAIAAHNRDV